MISELLKKSLPNRFGQSTWLNCKKGDGNVVINYQSVMPDSLTGYLVKGLKNSSPLSKLTLAKSFINKNLQYPILEDSDLEFAAFVETDTSIGLVITFDKCDLVNITIAKKQGWEEFYRDHCLNVIYEYDNVLLGDKQKPMIAKDTNLYAQAYENFVHDMDDKPNFLYTDNDKVENFAEFLIGSCGSLKEYYVEYLNLDEATFELEKDELMSKLSNYVIRCGACGNWSASYKRHCDDCEQPIA